MSDPLPPIRGFKLVFVVLGIIYVFFATSMLVRGVVVLQDFGVSAPLVSEPVLEDFFMFFYQLMAFVGVLTALFGLVTRDRRSQVLVASVFCLVNLLWAARDLSTSDSAFGNRLYHGEATLVFVFINLAWAAVFGALAIAGLWRRAP
jgi:hypothetical protein